MKKPLRKPLRRRDQRERPLHRRERREHPAVAESLKSQRPKWRRTPPRRREADHHWTTRKSPSP